MRKIRIFRQQELTKPTPQSSLSPPPKSPVASAAGGALRVLQQERLVATRLGLMDRAMELDTEIDDLLATAQQSKRVEEQQAIEDGLRQLHSEQVSVSSKLP
jgi:hypothetical protein